MPYSVVPHRFSVPFEELDGSPEELVTATFDGTTAIRTLKCLVRNRVVLINELLGYVHGFIVHPPAPYGPDIPRLLAARVAMKPMGKMGQVEADNRYADYTYCILTVTYEVMEKVLSSLYGYVTVTVSTNPISEFVTLPTKNLWWGGGAEKIADFDAPGKISHATEYIYEIRGATTYPSIIHEAAGHVNSSAYTITSLGVVPIETLLYMGSVITKEQTLRGIFYTIQQKFIFRNNGTLSSAKGHNHYPRYSAAGSTTSYERISDSVGNIKYFYPLANFANLFLSEYV